MPVYRSFDQEALDLQYNVRAGIPDHLDIFARWARTGEAFRRANAFREDIAYGEDAKQTYDLFPAQQAGRPTLVFIHGGYWQSLDKSDFSSLAGLYQTHDINFVVVNYRLAPDVRMGDIVEDNRQAVLHLYRNAASLGIERDALFVCGSSAGGHLTAALAGTDWAAYDAPANLIKGACAISGLYDLEPIRLCYLNKAVQLDRGEVMDFSPIHHLPKVPLPYILSVGGDESDEFHRLQAQFQTLLDDHGLNVKIARQRDGHHFDAVDRVGQAGNELSDAILEMIGVTARP
ncbi:esterase [Pandoraea capi]|uniref:Esterase n=1 Tax=Pandoraea capi TaxID=2508286 RepID=A0ABY6VKZ1_9BURK|nr:alpha/beta hydrolase [Pandoraea capi]VVD59971.1 esterase [Pandoraea capi]